jgi:hypothetical protein
MNNPLTGMSIFPASLADFKSSGFSNFCIPDPDPPQFGLIRIGN